ncbi:MAG: hypothetical protein WB586_24225 [Chthoniobacterales bacterium]
MNGNDKRGKFVELAGSVTLEDVLRIKVRRRRWAVALITLGISFLGLWLMIDVVRAGGWTPLKVAEVGLFCLLFTSLSFGFTQAFSAFWFWRRDASPSRSQILSVTTPPWHPRR